LRHQTDVVGVSAAYRGAMVSEGHWSRPRSRFAVLWSGPEGDGSGRLEVCADRFELSSRNTLLAVLFGDVAAAGIARGAGDRLQGLPVLWLRRENGAGLRIASLEGTGALYELARFVERPSGT
jgi:hypothetical protein